MENYLRIFDTEADYESVKDDLKFPTVSYTVDTDKLWYMVNTSSLYEWVDLGLPSGLKWSAWNVGATKPEEFGLYFAWGETQGYTGITDEKQFSWDDYKWNTDDGLMAKYNETDGLTTLEAADDAATTTDGSCRMPTYTELDELIENTTSEWVDDYNGTGVSGRIFTSNVNDNSIFIPAAGMYEEGSVVYFGQYGILWSSSLSPEILTAGVLAFLSEAMIVAINPRYVGFPIRPVKE